MMLKNLPLQKNQIFFANRMGKTEKKVKVL